MTSSICPGSIPALFTTSLNTNAVNSTGDKEASAPVGLPSPTGVRTAEMMNASVISTPP
jgi:hypothetical protein